VAIRPPARASRRLGAAGLATILGCALFVPDDVPSLLPFAVIATCFATAALISCHEPWLNRVLGLRWLRYAGRRSYAIYLWSSPLAYATVFWGGRTWGMATVLIVSTFMFAEVSWRLVERRFLPDRVVPALARPPQPSLGLEPARNSARLPLPS
jgi:peptidoglycan/LPS O-acetylase OafA/YrhL